MTDRKIIAVVGATGAQGGGLARAILSDPDGGFAVRAITRNPTSEKAAEMRDFKRWVDENKERIPVPGRG